MTSTHEPLTTFESRLLTELRAAVDERPPAVVRSRPRRRGVLIVAAAAVAVLAMSGPTLLPHGGPTPAFAVTITNDVVRIHINEMSDAAGLEQALAAKGVTADITYLPFGKVCAPGRYVQGESQPALRGGGMAFGANSDGFELHVDAGTVRAQDTLVLEMSKQADGSERINRTTKYSVGTTAGPVDSCQPVELPAAQ